MGLLDRGRVRQAAASVAPSPALVDDDRSEDMAAAVPVRRYRRVRAVTVIIRTVTHATLSTCPAVSSARSSSWTEHSDVRPASEMASRQGPDANNVSPLGTVG
jgi:hypothetical protein